MKQIYKKGLDAVEWTKCCNNLIDEIGVKACKLGAMKHPNRIVVPTSVPLHLATKDAKKYLELKKLHKRIDVE